MRVLVAQTRGAARVLTLLQQVTQLCTVQGSPTNTPVEVINCLTLDETHIVRIGRQKQRPQSLNICFYSEDNDCLLCKSA